jgi:hypothetical protein
MSVTANRQPCGLRQNPHDSTEKCGIREVVLVDENIVMGWTTGASHWAMAQEIEVELDRIDNITIDDCPCRAIPVSSTIIFRPWKEADVVPSDNNDYCDGGFDP